VGSTDTHSQDGDRVEGALSCFSNVGTGYVEIGAPGAEHTHWDSALNDGEGGCNTTGLISTYPGDNLAQMAGTSMASPLVAGAAALAIGLFRSHDENYTVGDIEAHLLNSARKRESLSSVFKDGNELDLLALAESIMEVLSTDAPPQPTTTTTTTTTSTSTTTTGFSDPYSSEFPSCESI
jgi:subtilisin family serine protease